MNDIRLTYQTVSANVLKLMQERKVTQKEMATTLGVEQPSISYKLHGKTSWTLKDLLALSNLFSVPVEDLLTEKNSEMAPAQVAA
ncbi:helix-turn-helix domain-containing protein [Pseudoscardovia radai]|uniref:helix-turn-helix domain-containing protein n=1 Tax=Pseudoscardovia radai TaxID=987066 RepID=UPI00399325FA